MSTSSSSDLGAAQEGSAYRRTENKLTEAGASHTEDSSPAAVQTTESEKSWLSDGFHLHVGEQWRYSRR